MARIEARAEKVEGGVTGMAAEFGTCIEIPCGLRGEDIPSIPEEVSQTVTEIHTNGGTTIRVRPEMVISELRV